MTKMNEILGSIFKDLDPKSVHKNGDAAQDSPGQAARSGDGGDRGRGDRRPARRRPNADYPGRLAGWPGLPG